MTQATITKVGSKALLPKTWRGARVLVRVTGNTATVTKIPKSQKVFSDADIRALRSLGAKISKRTLANAVRAARR
jgi:hypothetical protein